MKSLKLRYSRYLRIKGNLPITPPRKYLKKKQQKSPPPENNRPIWLRTVISLETTWSLNPILTQDLLTLRRKRFDDNVEDIDEKPIKSALKKSSHKEPAPAIVRPTLPPQNRTKRFGSTINIGTIGHVAHGKSTVVKAISGVQTVRFKNELERNITIKLGYANAKIYQCDNKELLRHVSFVDCPGHDILMSTMLSGAAVMDAALLLIAGNETCPQPQTSEHLAAIEIMKLDKVIILQNKVDLMREEGANQHYQSILKFIRGTVAGGAPIIPISAQLKFNIDAVNEALVSTIPVPPRDFTMDPQMIVIRSFDVNKPGAEIDELKGGVAGGSILHGVIKLGDEIEIRPGIVSRDEKGGVKCQPIFSRNHHP
ncbi:hypothetical protein EYC84_007291 [Monilinia fructicola]|uniref:Tr-type G domain-containing protein n=1 Tax=Monilinia fructicola TaxID=38448 RepID=A0A5M9KEC5_MONFR|nr:hypothetical protein EYC84_007291 [Monilinia fructicola]